MPHLYTFADERRGALVMGACLLAACSPGPEAVDGGSSDGSVQDAAARADAPSEDAGEGRLIMSDVPCELSDVRSVTVDATHEPHSPRLSIRYRVFPSDAANAPVVVIVPGGPGQPLLADDAHRAFALSGAPTNRFTVIYT